LIQFRESIPSFVSVLRVSAANMVKNFSILFIFIVVIIVGFFSLNYQKKISLISEKEDKKAEENFSITFVMFGKMGEIMGWNMAPELADSIMVVDYKSQNKTVNIVSLPRDLYVDLGGEKFKLNEVIKRGKVNDFLLKLPDITGVETDKFVVVNISILKDVVDNLGGIDIALKDRVVDSVSGYVMEAGQHHLSGDDAIWLVRNRFNIAGDFFREKNQYEVIQAIANKYKNLNPIEKSTFMFKMFPKMTEVETNIDFAQLISTFEKANDFSFNDIVMDFSTGLLISSSTSIFSTSTQQYILVPKIGQGDYSEVKNYIQENIKNKNSHQ
jgi:LCP family protein required for cell wall assembly